MKRLSKALTPILLLMFASTALAGDTPLGVRLGVLAVASLGIFGLFRLGRELAGDRCGWSDSVAASGLSLGPPPAPGSAVASDSSCGFIRVEWSAVAEADSYAVYREGAPLATVGGTAFDDTEVPPGSYLYTVAARNRCGESPAAEDSGTRPPDPPPPRGLDTGAGGGSNSYESVGLG